MALGAVLLALAACGPVPGGTLAGSSAPVPAEWAPTLGGDKAFCEIESRPADPHSIQLECFLLDGKLYVNSHRFVRSSWWPARSWALIWLEEPAVKVRIGDAIFALDAREVQDAAERDKVLRHRGYDPPPAGILVFRFEPRAV
jgi:hypothetical protein